MIQKAIWGGEVNACVCKSVCGFDAASIITYFEYM